jgi:hypothetical protein
MRGSTKCCQFQLASWCSGQHLHPAIAAQIRAKPFANTEADLTSLRPCTMHVAVLRTHRPRMFTSAALFWQEHVHENKDCEVPLQMLIDSSPTSQSCFSCPYSCQIRAAPVNILSRWVSRAAACVVWGPSDVRSAGYWQKASCGFEPRSLDSQSRVPTVTPRGQIKLAAFCAPAHGDALGVQTCWADRPAARHWRMSADLGGITPCCKAYMGVSTFGLSFPERIASHLHPHGHRDASLVPGRRQESGAFWNPCLPIFALPQQVHLQLAMIMHNDFQVI